MKKPSIPATPAGLPNDHFTMLSSMKENIEIIAGVRSEPIPPLTATATLPEVIVALNKVIDRLTPGG